MSQPQPNLRSDPCFGLQVESQPTKYVLNLTTKTLRTLSFEYEKPSSILQHRPTLLDAKPCGSVAEAIYPLRCSILFMESAVFFLWFLEKT